MNVTKSGMFTDVNEEQELKASLPMDVTDDGISTDASEEQYWKAR